MGEDMMLHELEWTQEGRDTYVYWRARIGNIEIQRDKDNRYWIAPNFENWDGAYRKLDLIEAQCILYELLGK